MNDYYLQQINDKLELIKSNTDQITTYLPNMSTELYYMQQNTQELVSGDILTRQEIIDSNYNTSVYLGCINVILMVILILISFPRRKGVLKKQ